MLVCRTMLHELLILQLQQPHPSTLILQQNPQHNIRSLLNKLPALSISRCCVTFRSPGNLHRREDAAASRRLQERSPAGSLIRSARKELRRPRQAAPSGFENGEGRPLMWPDYGHYFYNKIRRLKNPLILTLASQLAQQQQQQQHRPNRAKKMRLRRIRLRRAGAPPKIGLRPSGLRPKLCLASPFVGPMLPLGFHPVYAQ